MIFQCQPGATPALSQQIGRRGDTVEKFLTLSHGVVAIVPEMVHGKIYVGNPCNWQLNKGSQRRFSLQPSDIAIAVVCYYHLVSSLCQPTSADTTSELWLLLLLMFIP